MKLPMSKRETETKIEMRENKRKDKIRILYYGSRVNRYSEPSFNVNSIK